MGNPSSFLTAASTDDVNTFLAAQTIAPTALTSGVQTALTVTGAASAAVTASTEQPDVYYNGARTVTFATGALTNQRCFRLAAPTLAFAGASTVTNAATLYVDRAPQAGTNATITSAYALWIAAGMSKLAGGLAHTGTLGFYGTAPIAQQTGVAVSAAGIHAALVALGLITA